MSKEVVDETSSNQPASIIESPVYVWGTAILCTLFVALYLCNPIYRSDVFENLVFGRWMLAHWYFLREDFWTIVGLGAPWRSLTWGFDVLIALWARGFGVENIFYFRMLLTCLFVVAVSSSFVSITKEFFVGSFFAILVSCGVLVNAYFGANLIAFSLFVVFLHATQVPKEVLSSRGFLLFLFLLSAVYINAHPSAVFAVVVFLTCAAIPSSGSLITNRMRLSLVVVAPLGLTPDGISYLPQLVQSFSNLVAVSLPGLTIYSFPLGFFLILWVMMALALYFEARVLRPLEIFVLTLTSLFSLLSSEILPFGIILLGHFLVVAWRRSSGEAFGNLRVAFRELSSRLGSLPAHGSMFLLIALIVVNFSKAIKVKVYEPLFPKQEIDFILEESIPGPLYHDENIGAYVVYRFSDEDGLPVRLAAIDTRVPLLNGEMARNSRRAYALRDAWKRLFDHISPRSVLCNVSDPIFSYLSLDNRWKLRFLAGRNVDDASERERALANLEEDSKAWAVFQLTRENSSV